MTTRKLFTAALATLVLATPVAVSAAPAHPARHAPAHPHARAHAQTHRPMAHTGRHAPARAAAPRDGGSAAVDALNQQSLNSARGGTAPAPAAQ